MVYNVSESVIEEINERISNVKSLQDSLSCKLQSLYEISKFVGSMTEIAKQSLIKETEEQVNKEYAEIGKAIHSLLLLKGSSLNIIVEVSDSLEDQKG